MSLPGGPNNRYGTDGGDRQYYDPLSGHSLDGAYGHGREQYRGGHPPPPGAHVPSGPENSGYQSFTVSGAESGTGLGAPLPAPPRRSYGPTIAVVSTAVASIVVIITTLVLVNGDDEGRNSAAGVSTSTSAPGPTSSYAPDTSNAVAPVEPGWQSVPIRDAGIAYDVPPLWETDHEGITGFENESGQRVTMSNYSTYLDGFCSQASSSYRAVVGLTTIGDPNPESAAETVLRRVARLGWSSADGTEPRTELDSPQQAELDGGSLEGTLLSGTVTPATTGPCDSPSTYVSVLALSGQQETVAMIGIADQETVASVAPEEINRSLKSLRLT